MKSQLEDHRPVQGLRERKKLKTRAAIQREALRLFREQGYEETTVEQIAEAAEVSPSTFFRYFATKEDVVLYDAIDPVLIDTFRAQPAGLSPLRAMRETLRTVLGNLPPDELVEQRERGMLVFSEPELRSAMLDQMAGSLQMMADLVAERVDRVRGDPATLIFTGAIMGAITAALMPAIDDPNADFYGLIDSALDQLESGLPL